MLPPLNVEQAIRQFFYHQRPRVLAALASRIGDISLAEDALQDAAESALRQWPEQGLPNNPAAWLLVVAQRRAVDKIRRAARFADLQPLLAALPNNMPCALPDHPDESIPDKRLELIFCCCHPALNEKTRIALTLHTLGGLTTEEIAAAFLDQPKTMAQRLVRAKRKIRLAGIAYKIPNQSVLPERLSAVLAVIYFIFNEGYSARSGEQIVRVDLVQEAIRLARVVTNLLPEQAEAGGLLALMLLHDSRRAARQNAQDQLITLELQSRSLWQRALIVEGTTLLKRMLALHQLGPYQLQAAISAVHAEATDWASTDWEQIVALYRVLLSIQPSAVVQINLAMAISWAYGPARGLEALQHIVVDQHIRQYQPYYAARGDLYFRMGQADQAREDIGRAIELCSNQAESAFLHDKLNRIAD